MGQKIAILEPTTPELVRYAFFCPACGDAHEFDFKRDIEHFFWNKNFESPYVNCTLNNRFLIENWKGVFEVRCHSSIVNGMIVFFMDSTHHMAGNLTELPDWMEH